MSQFVLYLVTIATTIWSGLLDNIGEESARLIAYAFCLLGALVAVITCMCLGVKLFVLVVRLFGRGC